MNTKKSKHEFKRVKSFFGKYDNIPKDWDFNKLDSNVKIFAGFAFKSDLFDNNTGTPLIRIRDLSNNKTKTYYTGDYDEKYLVHSGDLLVGMDGTFRPCLWDGGNALLNQRVCKIISNNDRVLDQKFLYYIIGKGLLHYEYTKGNTTVTHISTKDIQNINIVYPPIREQQKISLILSDVDNLISKIQKELEHTKRLKVGLIQELLTIGIKHTQFKKMSLDFQSQEIKIPKDWQVTTLQSISEHITKGSTPTTYGYTWSEKPDDILFIRNECITQNGFQFDGSARISRKVHEFMKRSTIMSGDLLISITGEIGKTCLFPANYGEANINQHIARIRIASNQIMPRYVFYLLNSSKYRSYFYNINQSLIHPHLNLNQIQNTKIPQPPLKEQQKIVTILSDVDNLIDKQQQYQSHLKIIRTGFMQKLLTGKIKVPLTQ